MDDHKREMWAVAYRWHNKYASAPRSPLFWEAAAYDMHVLCQQHDNDPLLMEMLIAAYDDLGRAVVA